MKNSNKFQQAARQIAKEVKVTDFNIVIFFDEKGSVVKRVNIDEEQIDSEDFNFAYQMHGNKGGITMNTKFIKSCLENQIRRNEKVNA